MYLRYSHEDVAATKAIDPSYEVNVDYNAAGDVIGVEIVAPNDRTIEIATRFALENGLSLLGVFDPEAMAI
jgi:uncharacterized protein YuzE